MSADKDPVESMEFTFYISDPLVVGYAATWVAENVGGCVLTPDDTLDTRWKIAFIADANAIISPLRTLILAHEIDVMLRRP